MTVSSIACTAEALTLHAPLGTLPAPAREAVTAWLREHDIDPVAIAVGQPIERDERREILVWREQAADGVLVRTRFPAISRGATWPAPFPPLLRSA